MSNVGGKGRHRSSAPGAASGHGGHRSPSGVAVGAEVLSDDSLRFTRKSAPMSLWDHIPVEILIEQATRGNAGLAKVKWTKQLEQIRALPEAKR